MTTRVETIKTLPHPLNFQIHRGSFFEFETVEFSRDPITPVDRTGCTARAGLRDTDSAATLRLFTVTVAKVTGSLSVYDPVTRQTIDLGVVDYWPIKLVMPYTDTKSIVGGVVPWELDIIDSSGRVQTPFAGIVTTTGQVIADEDVV